MRKTQSHQRRGHFVALTGIISYRPREFFTVFGAAAVVVAIFINALFLQHGPHPAPIFAAGSSLRTPAARVAEPVVQARAPTSQPLPQPTSAAKTIANDPVRSDPIADLITPRKRVVSLQRALSEFGYGQINPTGQYGPETEQAIAKFERDHKMPITGQMSDRVVKAIAKMTNRSFD